MLDFNFVMYWKIIMFSHASFETFHMFVSLKSEIRKMGLCYTYIFIICSYIHSFIQTYLLKICYVLDTIVGAGDTAVN